MFAELLVEKLNGICTISAEQISQLKKHYQLLCKWNRVLNLTAVRDLSEIVERHYCESLFLGSHLPVETRSVADVGSGAGFPGFPVAVLCPRVTVTLIESHQRKAVFLRESARELPNVVVRAERAESVRGGFDWVVSRAVKYAEISATIQRLSPRAMLLTGEVSASELPGFEWREPILLPWGKRRYLWIGHDVSRGT